ncbi:MAG: MMPL family transporter [Clostridia bacterium]|nr:MMPL family transporter [Clostridia bacterium]
MRKMTNIFLRFKKTTMAIFGIMVLICAFLMTKVGINLDNSDYMPEEINSRQAAILLEEEFGVEGTAMALLESDSFEDIVLVKNSIIETSGVEGVYWLDDEIDINIPVSYIPEEVLANFYKDGHALLRIQFSDKNDSQSTYEAITKIKDILGEDSFITGAAVSSESFMSRAKSEMPLYMAVAAVLILLILLLSTESWLEPLIFMGVIGIAIIINMGTNIFFTDGLSNMTLSAAAVLQLAVSMDYAIFLLHRFHEERKNGVDVKPAMISAMGKAAPAILGSAFTTIAGFMALLIMDFGIGREIGLVLAKGVAISLAAVVILLPVITVALDSSIERLMHRSFIPDFKKLSKAIVKFRWVAIGLIIVLASVFFIAGSRVEFYYSDKKALPPDDPAVVGSERIDEIFGGMNVSVAMVPSGDPTKQVALEKDLMGIPGLAGVVGILALISPEDIGAGDYSKYTEQAGNEKYSRIYLYFESSETDSPGVFSIVEDVRETLSAHYGEWYAAGEPFSYYDLKEITDRDNTRSGILAIILVLLVVGIVFRSIGIPLAAVFVIEAAIYINLGITYFMGTPTSFISMIIISAVQLGATIDYAVLYVSRYKELREAGVDARESAGKALSDVFPSILTSAGILMAATFSIYFISSVATASEMCLLIGRGALISLLCVTVALPGLIMVMDKFIKRTSCKWPG